MATNPPKRQAPKLQRSLIRWLLDSDPSIRWQVMRDLIGAPADEVAAERARVATEGAGARLLALQGADGRWMEPCINGQVGAVGAYFGQDVGGIVDRLLAEQLPDGGWNCEAANGSTRSSFNTTICVLEALLEHERAVGASPEVTGARRRGDRPGRVQAGRRRPVAARDPAPRRDAGRDGRRRGPPEPVEHAARLARIALVFIRRLKDGDRARGQAPQRHRPHRDQRGRLHRASRRRSRVADVPPRAEGFLWHEHLHEIGGHDGAWSEDLRGEPAHGGEI